MNKIYKEELHSYFGADQLAEKLVPAESDELVLRVWREKTDGRWERRQEAEACRGMIKRLKNEIARVNQEKDRWQRKAAELEGELQSRERRWERVETAHQAREQCLEDERDKLRGELAVVSAELAGEHEEKERIRSSIVRCMDECGVFRERGGGRPQVVYAEYNTFAAGAVQIKGSVLPDARFAPDWQGRGKEAAL